MSQILVSAAASLTDVFGEIGAAFSRVGPGRTTVRFNFASSGALVQQIKQGAPVDVFASASGEEMDDLQRNKRIETATRSDFAGNRLALIAPPGSTLKSWEDLKPPAVRRIALSDPDSVPSGRYAQATLIRRRLWETVRPKAVFGQSVRQTLAYVAGGNVDAGVVFVTDARAEKKRVRVVAEAVPGRDHTPIVYPAAVVRGAPAAAEARQFVAFLRGPDARKILARYGFSAPPPKR